MLVEVQVWCRHACGGPGVVQAWLWRSRVVQKAKELVPIGRMYRT